MKAALIPALGAVTLRTPLLTSEVTDADGV